MIDQVDYVVVGGGLAGCAFASRLKEYDPSANITLLEAGPDEHENPLIVEPMGTFELHLSPKEYNYRTVPQEHYDGRQVFNAGGQCSQSSHRILSARSHLIIHLISSHLIAYLISSHLIAHRMSSLAQRTPHFLSSQ